MRAPTNSLSSRATATSSASACFVGRPPKVVWLQGHNLRNAEVVRVLRCNRAQIDAFVADAAVSLLVLRVDADGA